MGWAISPYTFACGARARRTMYTITNNANSASKVHAMMAPRCRELLFSDSERLITKLPADAAQQELKTHNEAPIMDNNCGFIISARSVPVFFAPYLY